MTRTRLLALALLVSLGACADMSDTSRRTLTGAGIGAVSGLAIGSLTGDSGWGALIGAGVGAAGGYLYDRHKQGEQRAYERGVQAGRAQPQ